MSQTEDAAVSKMHAQWDKLTAFMDSFRASVRDGCISDQGVLADLASAVARAVVTDAGDKGLLPTLSSPTESQLEDLKPQRLAGLWDFSQELKVAVEGNGEFFGNEGQELLSGLQDLLADHEQGSYGREDLFIRDAIAEHVRDVLQKIQSDSSNRAVLFMSYKREIAQLTGRIRRESDSLSQEALNPERREIEERRAKSFYQLHEKHQEQEKAVTEKSEVPSILQQHLESFNRKEMAQRSQLAQLQQQHKQDAARCLTLQDRQREFLESTMKHCRAAEARADRCLRHSETELDREIDNLQAHLERCQNLLQDIRDQRRCAQEHRLQRSKVRQLMEEAMQRVQEEINVHEQMEGRYARGQAVLSAFASWMASSYRFLEDTLLQRQQKLAEELPEQRRNFHALLHSFLGDLERRRSELKEAMRHRQSKMQGKFEDAAALERAPNRSQNARSKKRKAEELQSEIKDMQEAYDDLTLELQDLQGLQRERPTVQGSRWAQNILYNVSFGTPWSSPAALEAPQEPPSWGRKMMRRIIGKQPVSQPSALWWSAEPARSASAVRPVAQRLALPW